MQIRIALLDKQETMTYFRRWIRYWKTKKNYTLEHAAERIKIYTKEKFDYKIIEVELNVDENE